MSDRAVMVLYAFASFESDQAKEQEREMEKQALLRQAKSMQSTASKPSFAGRKRIPTRRR